MDMETVAVDVTYTDDNLNKVQSVHCKEPIWELKHQL